MKSVSQDPPVEIEDAASAPNPDGTSATVANGIGRLIEDHRELDKLFDELDNASGAVATKDLIIRVSRAISAHEDVEASVLGPVIRSRLDGGRRLSRLQRKRYHETERLLAIIARRSISSPDLPDLLTRVVEAVGTLIAEQESSTFLRVQAALSYDELTKLDDRVGSARRHATTRPHPYLSHHGSLAQGVRRAMAKVDRLRDRLTPRL